MKRFFILLLIAVMSTSCGTILSNIELEDTIGQKNILCGKITPFIYSGVWLETKTMIDCAMSSTGCGEMAAHFLVYDYLLTITADTVILPYSIYGQYKYCWSAPTDNKIR
jgi:uncharacterized protein YceK